MKIINLCSVCQKGSHWTPSVVSPATMSKPDDDKSKLHIAVNVSICLYTLTLLSPRCTCSCRQTAHIDSTMTETLSDTQNLLTDFTQNKRGCPACCRSQMSTDKRPADDVIWTQAIPASVQLHYIKWQWAKAHLKKKKKRASFSKKKKV